MNRLSISARAAFMLALVSILISGCGKKESSADALQAELAKPTQTPPSAPSSVAAAAAQAAISQTPINPVVKPEEYELMKSVDELGLTASLSCTSMTGAPDCSGDIEGTVDFIRVGSTQLELQTTNIVHEDNKAWIVTKNYGKIRVSGGYDGDHPPSGLCWWLTPSQKIKLKELYEKSK